MLLVGAIYLTVMRSPIYIHVGHVVEDRSTWVSWGHMSGPFIYWYRTVDLYAYECTTGVTGGPEAASQYCFNFRINALSTLRPFWQ